MVLMVLKVQVILVHQVLHVIQVNQFLHLVHYLLALHLDRVVQQLHLHHYDLVRREVLLVQKHQVFPMN